uniref:Thioredoxin domain containing 8 n=1 Tax=Sus scrofa TaxID=9823 RepID=A0A4X1V9A1_PIG
MFSSQDELKTFLRSAGNKLVVVEFSATWCGPCKRIYPLFHAMSLQYRNVMFANVDVDSARELARTYHINAIPTFQMFKQTQKVCFHGNWQTEIDHRTIRVLGGEKCLGYPGWMKQLYLFLILAM